MNRRQFIRFLSLSTIGATLDVDKLLWIPDRSRVFIPSAQQVTLFGIPYHVDSNFPVDWLGITRALEPWPTEKIMQRATFTPELLIQNLNNIKE